MFHREIAPEVRRFHSLPEQWRERGDGALPWIERGEPLRRSVLEMKATLWRGGNLRHDPERGQSEPLRNGDSAVSAIEWSRNATSHEE
jgi:hypothetical protein